MAKEPLLSLDTLVEHETIKINGKPYDLANLGELTIVDTHRLSKKHARVDELREKADLSESDVEEFRRELDWMVRLILRAPAEVVDQLGDQHKLRIIRAFTQLLRDEEAPLAAGEPEAPETSTGERRSPA